jgi:hypothetical protein
MNSLSPKALGLWNGIYTDNAAFILQNADPLDVRAVEFQANADTAAVLGDENGAGAFKRGLRANRFALFR